MLGERGKDIHKQRTSLLEAALTMLMDTSGMVGIPRTLHELLPPLRGKIEMGGGVRCLDDSLLKRPHAGRMEKGCP